MYAFSSPVLQSANCAWAGLAPSRESARARRVVRSALLCVFNVLFLDSSLAQVLHWISFIPEGNERNVVKLSECVANNGVIPPPQENLNTAFPFL